MLAAWNNGRAPFRADDGLRGRRPRIVEWKGAHRDPAAEAVPADLRIDHVYLVSCKYLSKVLHNASPWSLFERFLVREPPDEPNPTGSTPWRRPSTSASTNGAVQHFGHGLDLPERVGAMTKAQRRELTARIPREWSAECVDAYRELAVTVASTDRPNAGARARIDRERAAMVWRLLRLGPAPYFVLGTGARVVAADSGWRRPGTGERPTSCVASRSSPDGTGQARLSWPPRFGNAGTGDDVEVTGHVEIRWSHGRFGGPPEAKVYLDTPHARVPGYFPLV